VLWDLGWLTNESKLSDGYFTYSEIPKRLVYGKDRELFFWPLEAEGHGIPEIPIGANRIVRLYVHYGHQDGCFGTPTVLITSGQQRAEFSLPQINGYYGNMSAEWSDFKDSFYFQEMGHANIMVYQKNFVPNDACGSGEDRPKGVIYRVEAHFYDEY
jgi:hypothetical protein